ncbi:MAG: hypothetical protein EB084_14440 [Proteobacteria bacterium]|nr:hypothetical protein [Pseudomonadota bacterium]
MEIRRLLLSSARKSRKGLLAVYIVALVGAIFLADTMARTFVRAPRITVESAAGRPGEKCHLGQQPTGDCGREGSRPAAVVRHERGEASQITESTSPDGTKTKTITFRGMRIDKLYPSMTGPSKDHTVLLGGNDDGVWITRYKAEVLDPESGRLRQEYMCHTSLDLLGTAGTEASTYHRQELTVSQGQEEIAFPKGFALHFPNDPLVDIHVLVMVLNNNDPDLRRDFDFRTTLRYAGDKTAREQKLVPLFQTGFAAFPLLDSEKLEAGETGVRTATEKEVERGRDGRQRTGHWMVPPGRQVIRETSALGLSSDTTIHYIWMHVHPYAESVELRDKTAEKTLWKGRVVNDPDARKARLVSTEHFESTQGIPVFKGHVYELVSTYNNPTNHDIDAMASLWIYARSAQ